ncbi:Gfo/Idh/MocA family oxidoreductase [Alphaproteobacteria bacterium]|nr:Gfo/Idh/MocA family oxidoreductase [Alphaproteobacteria bacterium]
MLRVGIAGYGVVGKRRKECLDLNPNVEVVALSDKMLDVGHDPRADVKKFQNYAELLSEKLDLLFVCLTNDLAAEVTIAAIQSGIHVFCEKPPGKTVEDVQRVIDIHKLNPSIKLMYGFNHRYHESIVDALKIIRSEELGKVINLRGVYGKAKLITFNQPDWRTNRSIAGGGVLLDQGIHMLDLMRLFVGDFTSVHSFVSNGHWGYDVEDNAYALMKTESGVVGMLNSSATQWRHRFNLDVNLERGSLILGGLLSGTKSYGAETLTVVRADPDNDKGDPRETTTSYNKDPSWQTEVDAFVDAVIGDKHISSGSPNDALETMKLVYRIYYSDPTWRKAYTISNPDK